jgi:hypothetical protein
MEYVQDVLNRKTGKLDRTSLGDWITITELGERYGLGNRQTRTILREMGFLVVEGADRIARHRLATWVTERGWGRRLRPVGRFPFDVVGPDAQCWIDEHWAAAEKKAGDLSVLGQQARDHLSEFMAGRRKASRTPMMMVTWLCDHYPGLSQSEKGRIVGISQQLVSRFEAGRRTRLNGLMAQRQRPGPPSDFPITRHLGASRHITEAHNWLRNVPAHSGVTLTTEPDQPTLENNS